VLAPERINVPAPALVNPALLHDERTPDILAMPPTTVIVRVPPHEPFRSMGFFISTL
jgi:hypothetical protein